MSKPKVIIDTDPGHDDAMAIVLAAQHLDILGITPVSGNQSIDKVTNNALKIVELLKRTDIPVARGAERPLVKEPSYAPYAHGESGMDGPNLPAPVTPLHPKHAVDFIIDTVMSTDDVTLIPVGPLTNVALALRREPRIAKRIKEFSIMGGSATHGNSTPAAEFNIWVDPEAAHAVFTSGVPIKMIGLNLTLQVTADDAMIARCKQINNPVARFVVDLLGFYADKRKRVSGGSTGALHDPLAVAAVIDPSLIEFHDLHVAVDTRPGLTNGMTVVDYRHLRGAAFGFPQEAFNRRGEAPNAQVAFRADGPRFFKLFYDTLEMYG